MGGGRQQAKPNPAKKKRREWRIRGWRVRNLAAGGLLLAFFAMGFYLAQLYGEISALIEQRRAAMTSAIFSAPFPIRAGDDLDRSGLLDRLAQLSYSQVPSANAPGEYTRAKNAIAIYLRSFYVGAKQYPAEMVRVSLEGTRIAVVADSFGVAKSDAMLEPEVIGRLLPGAPAERVEVQLDQLKPYLVKGLLDTEDRFFYYHPGIDPIRIVEAAISDLHSHRLAQGASTLTQQLARTFMERHERSFSRKFRELAVAAVLEIRLRKDEILERYINDVPMGEYEGTPIDGMPQAARYFFNKDLSEVTPAEAATLIGMIQAPTLYDPRRHPDSCIKRRNVVLGVMKHAGVIDDATYTAAIATPIQITKPPGLRRAPYFTDYVTAFVTKIPGFDGHLEGLKVYTTLDTELQADAVDAVSDNIAALEKNHKRLRRAKADGKLQTSLVALDADSGAIRAMIGGRDYSESQFNRAANAERQPGSAFKPIVYLAALDPDRAPFSPPLTLASVLPDEPMTFNGWTPANYERTYQPQVTVVQALYESLNVPTAYVGNELGPATIVKTAHEMGIHEDLQAYLPISIGADETTLLELTSAYQVFAAEGEQSPPYAVEAVVDAKGHQIYQHEDRIKSHHSTRRGVFDHGRSESRPALWHRRERGPPGDRFSGGGQDRHDAGLQGRVLYRLHAGDCLWRLGRLRCAREPRPDRRAGGAAGVGSVHAGCGAGRPGRLPRAVGYHDGDDRSRVRRPRDPGMPQTNPAAVPARHRADADVSSPRRNSRERAGACSSDDYDSAGARIHAARTSRASESVVIRRLRRSRQILYRALPSLVRRSDRLDEILI